LKQIFFFVITICAITFTMNPQAQDEGHPARIPPGDVLKRAAETLEALQDYQGLIHQVEAHPSGRVVERWALVTLIQEKVNSDVQEDAADPAITAMFRLDFYNRPVNWELVASGEIDSMTPETVYFSDNTQRLYTYKPENNSLTVDWLNENAPIEEFLYIAGFVDFDLDTFYEKAYLDDQVWSQEIDGVDTYRVKAVPRRNVEGVLPPRLIWFDKESKLPKRFAVEGDVEVQFDFLDWKVNQNLDMAEMIPEIPVDVYFVDHTEEEPF